MGPNASLAARDIGMDFAGADGWRMYHGSIVPGFPSAPASRLRDGDVRAPRLHRPLRFARRNGALWSRRRAVADRGRGDRACEMFPLLDRDGPNPCELFQIWLNLPAADKMVPPYFTMFWDQDIPRLADTDDEGRATEVTVIAGALAGLEPQRRRRARGHHVPRPTSASGTSSPSPRRAGRCPPAAGPDTVRTLYVFEGSLRIGEHDLEASTGAVLRAEDAGRDRRRPVRRRGAGLAGPPDRRTGRAVRPVRDERPGGHRAGVRGLPAHGLRRMAVADRRPGAPARRRSLRPARRRPSGTTRRGRRSAPVVLDPHAKAWPDGDHREEVVMPDVYADARRRGPRDRRSGSLTSWSCGRQTRSSGRWSSPTSHGSSSHPLHACSTSAVARAL